MDEKILRLLRTHRDCFLPAQDLSRRLAISLPKLSKQIQQLRCDGYDIQSQPHWGYRLISLPDRLLAQEITWQLDTKIVGQKIISYNMVDSTNSIAFSLAEKGASEGTTIFAEGQRKGRGRLGRSWASPKHTGIYFSLILRPKLTLEKAGLITLMAAVSCAETIRRACGLPALIRWPNDILLNNKKICGILTEIQTQGSRVNFIILGIGINVNTPLSKLPLQASSLQEEAKNSNFSRIELAQQLLRRLDQDYLHFEHRGAQRFLTHWKNLSYLSGRRVKVYSAQGLIEGLAQDIDEQGALIVRLDNGFKQHLLAGDVVRVR